MDHMGNHQEDLTEILDQLRWLLYSFRLSGIENWAASPKTEKPLPEEKAPKETVPPLPKKDPAKRLIEIREELGDCRRCRLHQDRTHIVFGEGSPTAPLVFVGEGPGADEDRQGRPFIGRAGKLLDKMIRAMGLRREDVYICNIVKCRPPQNRTPNKDEVDRCSPFLIQQLEAIHPRIICALGAPAAQTLLNSTQSISRLRGKIHYWRGIPLVATFHPAYLLRNPIQKAPVWQDLIVVRLQLKDS